MFTNEELLTVPEAAELLRMSLLSVYHRDRPAAIASHQDFGSLHSIFSECSAFVDRKLDPKPRNIGRKLQSVSKTSSTSLSSLKLRRRNDQE
jgi:hypothetical protein